MRRTLGFVRRAAAKASRFRSPPDNCLIAVFLQLGKCNCDTTSITLNRRSVSVIVRGIRSIA